jgi:hypothetical protein
MFVIGILVVLSVTAVIVMATRSRRGITVTVWIVGGAYAIFGFAVAVFLFVHDEQLWLAALACALAAAAGPAVHRSRPVLAAGSLMAGAFVIAAGPGVVVAGLVAWGENSLTTVLVAGLVATLIVFVPALLTGVALIRGPRRSVEEARL